MPGVEDFVEDPAAVEGGVVCWVEDVFDPLAGVGIGAGDCEGVGATASATRTAWILS